MGADDGAQRSRAGYDQHDVEGVGVDHRPTVRLRVWIGCEHVAPAVVELQSDEQLALVKYDDAGLVPAIVQEEGTGAVLMMAWMTADTLRMSLEEGRTVFWSRSRSEEWRKGDTSGDRQFIREAYYDCDGDTLLFVVEQEGRGACHTGDHSCFHRAFGAASES